MKVYVVLDTVNLGVAGVFSSREGAENFISMNDIDEDYLEIQEFHLDCRTE